MNKTRIISLLVCIYILSCVWRSAPPLIQGSILSAGKILFLTFVFLYCFCSFHSGKFEISWIIDFLRFLWSGENKNTDL